MQTKALYFGDNLKVLGERAPDGTFRFPSESVDLVYLDPPFNSNRDYNLLFKEQSGEAADALIRAFEDTWRWDRHTVDTYEDLTGAGVNEGRIPDHVGQLVESLVRGIGRNDMSAYLVMMTPRLLQLHRVLKETGSLWLHCDPTASHYLKVILDGIFNPEHFLAEVIWKRTSAHSSANRPGPVHDTILGYSRGKTYTWNQQYQPYDAAYLDLFFEMTDADNRRWKRMDLTGAGTRNGATGQPWRGIDITAKGRHWAYPPSELESARRCRQNPLAGKANRDASPQAVRGRNAWRPDSGHLD